MLGAILAGVNYVLMGAGVPREIPRLLDDLSAGCRGGVKVDVHGSDQTHRVEVDPQELLRAADYHWDTVVRANAKTVTTQSDIVSWTMKYPYAEIKDHKRPDTAQ